ncbi:hypothetical protein ACFLU6_06595 [Acidobacteriota bacterium]
MGNDDRWLFFFMQGAPCACRCKHCDFAVSASCKPVPISRLVEFTEPFIEARDKGEAVYKNLGIHLGDCALNHPELSSWVGFLKQHHIEGWLTQPANGIHTRGSKAWRPFLESLRSAGTEMLEFTLYGKEEIHDWFAGRKGGYAAIGTLADLWREMEGQIYWSVVVHKKNISQLGEIRSEILDIHGVECALTLWSYLGHGTAIEDLRIEASDVQQAESYVQEALESFRQESEWTEQLACLEETPFPLSPIVIHVAIDPTGKARIPYMPVSAGHEGIEFAALPVQSVSKFMSRWDNKYTNRINRYPLVHDLCRSYGDKGSTKLHDRQSVIRKWCSQRDLCMP